MEIVYSDHNKDITIFYDVVKHENVYKVHEKNVNDNSTEITFTGNLDECIQFITNNIIN